MPRRLCCSHGDPLRPATLTLRLVKAAVCVSFGRPLVIEEIAVAAPRPGQIGVRLSATAICHSDIHFVDGAWGGELPAVFGHEAAGVVDELGAGVDGFALGDHVVVTLIRSCGSCAPCSRGELVHCDATFEGPGPLSTTAGQRIVQGLRTGAFAERVVVDRSQAVVIAPAVPLDSAALLACGVITGYGAVVNSAQIEPGSCVIVIGTGGVGINAVQGAALAGAGAVVAVDLSDAKLEAATRLGATHTINSSRENVVAAVRALTGGRGADYAFVTVGATSAVEQGPELLRPAGTMVIVGMPGSGARATIDPTSIANAETRILGSKMGSARIAVDVPALVELYLSGRLKLDELITRRYPIEEINDAIESSRRGEAIRNVVMFGPEGVTKAP